MQYQNRSGEADIEVSIPAFETEALSPSLVPLPRRRILRALSGVAVGAVVLIGLAGCGGEDGEGNGDGDEEEDD